MKIRRWTLGAAAALGVLLAIGLAGPASAEGTGGTRVGHNRCSDQVQSDNGARVVASMAYATGEWTVRRASSVGGAETVVFRAPAGSMTSRVGIDQTLAPTAPGTFLYRLCLDVSQAAWVRWPFLTYGSYDLSITSTSPTAVTDIGPDTATLIGNSNSTCGDLTAVPGNTVRLVGNASSVVRWHVYDADHLPEFAGDGDVIVVDSTSIDQTLVVDPEVTHVRVCAMAVMASISNPVSVSFELSA